MGEVVCVAVPLLFFAVVIALTVRSAVIGWKLRERWGTVHALHDAGRGAYRAGTVTERRLRGVPWTVMVAGVSGTALSLLTGFVFAPSGLLGALVLGGHHSGLQWMAFVLMFASTNGIALAVGLFLAARQTLECEWGAGAPAIRVGIWSLVHHGALIAACGVAMVTDSEGWWVAIAFAAPGLVQAALTIAAGRRVGAIQRSLTPEERDALGWVKEESPPPVVGMLG